MMTSLREMPTTYVPVVLLHSQYSKISSYVMYIHATLLSVIITMYTKLFYYITSSD